MTKVSLPSLYKERVLPSLSFYAATLFVPLALFFIILPFSESVPAIVALSSVLSIFVISWLTAPLITLDTNNLRIGKTRIDKKFLGTATAVYKQDAFKERGSRLDIRAFTKFQVGIQQLVRVEINDEDDPTPYWLIATRNPEVLAAQINKL